MIRRIHHDRVSASPVARSDDELVIVLQAASDGEQGRGRCLLGTGRRRGVPVFANRISIIDRDWPVRTAQRTLYDVPAFASTACCASQAWGFGAWRSWPPT